MYIVTTLLDPQYKSLLNATQLAHGKKELLVMLKDSNGSDSSGSSSVESGSPAAQRLQDHQKSRFSHLSKVLEKKAKEDLHKAFKLPLCEVEIKNYLENIHSYRDKSDPLLVWMENQQSFH